VKRRKQINERREIRRNEARAFVCAYLADHPCVECGEDDIVVLEFDHVRGEKKRDLCYLVCNGYTLRIIEDEVAKCEVRCANCHKRKTAHQGNFYRVQMSMNGDRVTM
jgi:hypothetical protein